MEDRRRRKIETIEEALKWCQLGFAVYIDGDMNEGILIFDR